VTVISDIYLEVNGIPLETYAWRTLDTGYDELLNSPAIAGDDLRLPLTRGQRPFPRVVDRTTVSVPLLIVGSLDEDGVPIADPMDGMFTHRDYLRNGLGIADDGSPSTGTVTATFYRGTVLSPLSGEVTVLGLNGFALLGHGEALVRLDLSIPDGELADTGS
jgi:hypothetical protein